MALHQLEQQAGGGWGEGGKVTTGNFQRQRHVPEQNADLNDSSMMGWVKNSARHSTLMTCWICAPPSTTPGTESASALSCAAESRKIAAPRHAYTHNRMRARLVSLRRLDDD